VRVAIDLTAKPSEYPTRISFGTKEYGALVVVNPGDSKPESMKIDQTSEPIRPQEPVIRARGDDMKKGYLRLLQEDCSNENGARIASTLTKLND
jgi:hypothetical protein